MTNSNAGTIPVSQSAASVSKMSQATVNRSTGIPEISYPAGSVQGKSMTIPITLVYDASGRRVNEPAGEVGWGWNLTAGGAIVRNIVGDFDEIRCIGEAQHPNVDSDLDGNFTWSEWNSAFPVWVIGIPENFDPGFAHQSIARDASFFQPDEFTFVLPDGRSGTFVINQDGEVVTIPYMSLTIDFEEHYYGFTITDDAGMKYIFNTRSVSYTSSPTGDNTYDNQSSEEIGSFTSWYLDEIQNANGDIEFSFLYIDKGFEQVEENYWSTKTFSNPDVPLAYMQAFDDLNTTYLSNVQKKRLMSIQSSLGTSVEFGYPTDEDLQVITFRDFVGDELYHLNLNKGIFPSENQQSDRLKLEEITLVDPEATTSQVTSFTYDTNGGNPFPPLNSNARDHWGYYNGLIESGLTIRSVNGTIRRVDPDYNQMGILLSVTGSNGSVITYEYETNTYASSPDGLVSLSATDLSTSRIIECSVEVEEEDFYQLDDNSDWEFVDCDCSTAWNGHLNLCCYVQMESGHSDYGYTFYNPNDHISNNESGSDNEFDLDDDDDVDHPWNQFNEDESSLETIYSPNIESRSRTNQFFLEFDQEVALSGIISRSKWPTHLNSIQIVDASNAIVWQDNSSIASDLTISDELELTRGVYQIITKVYYPRFHEVEQTGGDQVVFPMNAQIRESAFAEISIALEVKSIYPSASEKYSGGLRVSRTVVSDGDTDSTNDSYTQYAYDVFGQNTTSGYLLSDPRYECQMPYFFSYIKGCQNNTPCFQSDFTFYTDAGINQLLTASGSYVLYSNVVTEQCSADGCDNGWIEEEFSIVSSSNSSPIFNNKVPYKKWRSGLPTVTRIFNESGGLISAEIRTYGTVYTNPISVRSLFAGITSVTHRSHNLSINCGNVDQPCGGEFAIVVYDGIVIDYVSEVYSQISESRRIYDQTNQTKWMESSTTYEFDSEMIGLPSRIITHTNDPDNPYTGELIKYVADYEVSGPGDEMTTALNYIHNTAHFGFGLTVETVELKGMSPTTMNVVGGSINSLKLSSEHLVQSSVYKLELPHSMQESAFNLSSVVAEVFEFNGYYRQMSHATEHNENGQVVCAEVENDIPRTYLRDYSDGRVVADIYNATVKECAYTSFETENGGGWDYPTGSFSSIEFAQVGFMLPYTRTGTYAYSMNNGDISREISNGSYILSYWTNGDNVNIAGEDIDVIELVLEDDFSFPWTYHEYQIDYSGEESSELVLSATNTRIDELRLYPIDASMTTKTFNTDGTVSSSCDANNFCSYYLYDGLNRKEWILDDNFQIVSHHTYHVKDLEDPLDFSWQKDQVILEAYITKGEVESSGAGNSEIRSNITYLDGLGREIETIEVRSSPNGRDVVTFHKYDSYSREPRFFAPCTADIGNDGDYIPISELEIRQLEFYDNTTKVIHTDYPFADIEFEPSPAGRIIKQGNFGENWQITSTPGVISSDHVTKTLHLLNDANEVLNWQIHTSMFSAMSNGDQGVSVYYPENSLTKQKIIDEEGRVSYEFKDQSGKVICKRVVMQVIGSGENIYTHHDGIGEYSDLQQTYKEDEIPWTANLDSYFIYDDFDRLIFEIPAIAVIHCNGVYAISTQSMGIHNSVFNGYTTCHSYDRRGRLIREKKPSEDWSEFVYNDLNQLVMLNSAELGENLWKFLKYDLFGRVIQTGIIGDTSSRSSLQYYFDTEDPNLWETKAAGTTEYTNVAYPAINAECILSETYYDNYEFDLNGYDFENLGIEEARSYRLRGNITGQKTKVLDDSVLPHYLTRVEYFDKKGRSLVSIEENLLEGYDKIQNYYDYTGQLTDTKRTHLRTSGEEELEILNYFEYDHLGRSKLTWQKTGTDQWVALNKLVYNELGQVVNKHIHLTSGTNTGMQIIDYRYNERGWLTKINNADLANDGDNDQSYDVFGEELIYFEENRFESDDMNMIPKHDGSVAAMKWKTNITFTDNPEEMEEGTELPGHSYVFRYDDLGQLVGSYYASSSDIDPCNYTYRKHMWDEKTNYDINGNVLKMMRWREVNGVKTGIDKLTMSYIDDTNQLLSITDSGDDEWSTTFSHFVDNTGGVDYEYDQEGRLTTDNNKHFEYSYNHLDLVSEVHFAAEQINFIWDALGRKHAKIIDSEVTHYLGGFEYVNDALVSITTQEGIVRRSEIPGNEEDWVYDYYLKDHLGNIRAVITEEQSEITTEKVTNEIAKRLEEEDAFDNVGQTAELAPYLYPYDPEDPYNQIVTELNAYGGEIIGPAKLAFVKGGERIDLSTKYWYQELPSENPLTEISEILAGILLNMGTAASGVIQSGPEAGMALLNNVSGAPFSALSDFVDDAFDEVDLSLPQAYLVYMFFDEATMTIQPKKSGIIQVGQANELGVIARDEIIPNSDGFFYCYVTNRSHLSVKFDNLTVKRWKPMVRVSYDYYPYGLTWRNPASSGTDDGVHNCTYQDKEYQFGEFGDGEGLQLHDFHARMYDGTIGRWLVPDPAAQFNNPYLAMGNNPIMFEDPDGRFINQIFDAMEYVSPIVIRPLAHTGTDQRGFGWEVSIGIPKMYGLSYRWEYGRVKYKRGFGDKSGTEVYKGGEVTYFGVVSFGGKHYQGNYGDGEFTQTTGTVTIGVPFLNVKYENDIFPWSDNKNSKFGALVGKILDNGNLGLVPSPDKGDRYRSAGLEMNVFGLSWGFQLFTGDPGFNAEDRMYDPYGGKKEIYKIGLPGTDPNKYREGIMYYGIGPFRFGTNREKNRHCIQNRFAHDNKVIDPVTGRTVPWFRILDIPEKRYFYFGTGSGLGVY